MKDMPGIKQKALVINGLRAFFYFRKSSFHHTAPQGLQIFADSYQCKVLLPTMQITKSNSRLFEFVQQQTPAKGT